MKKINVLLLTLIFCMTFGTFALAADTSTTQGSFPTQSVTPNVTAPSTSSDGISGINANGGLPDVTIDQASSWAERKGFQIVSFLQTVVQPFSIIIFIVGAIVAMLGIFSRSAGLGKGLITMLIAVVMYIAVLFAPEILDFMVKFAKS